MDNPWIPTGDDFRAAQARIKPHVLSTPLLRAEPLERQGRRVFLKPENLQKTNSFKVRGAFNALLSLEPAVRAAGAVAFSSGNHGAAVAYAARELGMAERQQPYPCTIVVPEDANPVKLASMKKLGAEIVACGRTVEERKAKAYEIGKSRGCDVIPSYDDRRVISGQGTLGLEIMDQWMAIPSRTRKLYLVAAPIGGGGMMSGTSAALRARGFSGRIVGVEPELGNDTAQSFDAGQRLSIDLPLTVCDGLRSTTPGELTFPILKKCLEGVVCVSDEAVISAVKLLLGEMKLLVEPSGAIAVAAWMNGLLDRSDEDPGDVILVVTGGNIDPEMALSWYVGG
jgi:threonine dehydratase